MDDLAREHWPLLRAAFGGYFAVTSALIVFFLRRLVRSFDAMKETVVKHDRRIERIEAICEVQHGRA